MDREIIAKLENYIFEHKNKPGTAAGMMTDYIGVMIGVKPAAVNYFNAEELSGVDLIEFNELLNRAGLKALFFRQDYVKMGKLVWIKDIYVSRNTETAFKLHQAFEKLYNSMDDIGQTINQKLWEESSREIGHLLGYPETAIEYFIAEQDIENEERQRLSGRYQFYIHSPQHHEREYRAYDAKIFQAIREYTPKTADIMLSRKSK